MSLPIESFEAMEVDDEGDLTWLNEIGGLLPKSGHTITNAQGILSLSDPLGGAGKHIPPSI